MYIWKLVLKFTGEMSSSELIIGIIIPVFLSIFTTLTTLLVAYLSRRNLLISCNLNDTQKYTSFFENELDYYSFVFHQHETELKKAMEFPESFRILEVIITNNSPKPIYIQKLLLHDTQGNQVQLVDRFIMEFANQKNIPDVLTIISNENNQIYFEKINVFTEGSKFVKPYESLIYRFALDYNVDKIEINAYTTLTRFFLLRYIGKINNYFRQLLSKPQQEINYKVYTGNAKTHQ
ncbi:hypothetical protein PT250_02530 [Erysipelothrix rhusiopathiae]|nr:hypothetical protein [Erysipelothrix rhusiopathiae]